MYPSLLSPALWFYVMCIILQLFLCVIDSACVLLYMNGVPQFATLYDCYIKVPFFYLSAEVDKFYQKCDPGELFSDI